MTGMIPKGQYSVRRMAGFLGVSDRRIRELIERGELSATRMGKRSWAIKVDDARVWEHVHPRRGRRLTNDAQWALIAELAGGLRDWMSPLLRHRTRKRIREWTPQQIADAVSQRGEMPEAMQDRAGRLPHMAAFERAESPDRDAHLRGLADIADQQEFWHQRQRFEWWEKRGIQFQDFWAAPDPPADGVLPVEVPDGAIAMSDVSDKGVSWSS